MAEGIKAQDLKLVGDLFGDGYVMDFTNQTYQEFFLDEVGVEIYDDVYLINNGNSKGKRLRAFMQRAKAARAAARSQISVPWRLWRRMRLGMSVAS